jgi:hypothetical protein
MSGPALDSIAGFGGGYAGLENYYSAKIDAIEAQQALARDNRFASVAQSLGSSQNGTPKNSPSLNYSDSSELRQPGGSLGLQGAALNNVRSAPV